MNFQGEFKKEETKTTVQRKHLYSSKNKWGVCVEFVREREMATKSN